MRKLLLAALVSTALAGSAQAATLLTSEVGYTGPGLDLSAYANGMYNFTFGPIPVDSFTFTAAPGGGGNSGLGSVVGQGGYGLLDNGFFGGDAVYIGVDSATGYAQLLGTTAYSQIGFFMNYASPPFGENPTIWTLDAGGNVIDSFDLSVLAPISTPGGFNAFEFRGVAMDTASIYGLRFGGSYILVTGTADGTVQPIPEPAAWAFMIVGFGAVGLSLRSARKLRPAEAAA